MSTNSPNFNLVVATTADRVNVVTQVANNFSTVDAVLGVLHTGSGQFKGGVFIPQPQMSNPVITGTLTGVFSLAASTGSFNTITATGGALTVNSLSMGTYGFPAFVGSTGYLLTVQTGNAVWAAGTPNTGANSNLSNLASVAINTSLGTFTGGLATLDKVITTSGALTGLTVFQATTGTFAGNLMVTGTLTANAVVCTGGTSTFAGLSVGTYALPSTLGSTGQFLRVAASTLGFADGTSNAVFCLINGSGSAVNAGAVLVGFPTIVYDAASSASSTGYTTPSSGVYNIVFGGGAASCVNGTQGIILKLVIATTSYSIPAALANSGNLTMALSNWNIIQTVAGGVVISMTAVGVAGGSFAATGVVLSGFKMPNL